MYVLCNSSPQWMMVLFCFLSNQWFASDQSPILFPDWQNMQGKTFFQWGAGYSGKDRRRAWHDSGTKMSVVEDGVAISTCVWVGEHNAKWFGTSGWVEKWKDWIITRLKTGNETQSAQNLSVMLFGKLLNQSSCCTITGWGDTSFLSGNIQGQHWGPTNWFKVQRKEKGEKSMGKSRAKKLVLAAHLVLRREAEDSSGAVCVSMS